MILKAHDRHLRNPRRGGYDWCHLCGKRNAPTVDVWFPRNAEHQPDPKDARIYLRVCADCGEAIAQVGRGQRPDDAASVPRNMTMARSALHLSVAEPAPPDARTPLWHNFVAAWQERFPGGEPCSATALLHLAKEVDGMADVVGGGSPRSRAIRLAKAIGAVCDCRFGDVFVRRVFNRTSKTQRYTLEKVDAQPPAATA